MAPLHERIEAEFENIDRVLGELPAEPCSQLSKL